MNETMTTGKYYKTLIMQEVIKIQTKLGQLEGDISTSLELPTLNTQNQKAKCTKHKK